MRHLYLVLAMIIGLAAGVSAQSDELMLDWDPVYNTVRGTVELRGSANIPGQQWFFVEAAPYIAGADAAWTPIVSFQMAPVVDGSLGTWNTSILNDGFYQVSAARRQQRSGEPLLHPGPDRPSTTMARSSTPSRCKSSERRRRPLLSSRTGCLCQ